MEQGPGVWGRPEAAFPELRGLWEPPDRGTAVHLDVQCSHPTLHREPKVTGIEGTLRAPADALMGSWWPWSSGRVSPTPTLDRFPGAVPSAPDGGTAPGWSGGREARWAAGPLGLGEKGADQQGCYSIVIPNRALEQTLVKMPVPWAGLAPCPLPPQQTPEPAYPTSPAFPPLSCPFASRVVYQDGFYGAEIYVSAAPGKGGWHPGIGSFPGAVSLPVPAPPILRAEAGGGLPPWDLTQPGLGYPCSVRGSEEQEGVSQQPSEPKPRLPVLRGVV